MVMEFGISVLIQGVLAFLLIWLLLRLNKTRVYLKQLHASTDKSKFHHLPSHWLWGTLPFAQKMGLPAFLGYLVQETKNHGKCLVFWKSRLLPTLILTNPKAIGDLMRTSEPKNRSVGGGYTLALPWIGEGLLISSGKRWERSRKLLTPAFHFKVLQPYVKIYNEAVESLMTKIGKVAGTGESYEVFDPVALCTLDVMLRCAFSYDGNVQTHGGHHRYVQAVKSLAYLIGERSLKPLQFIDWIYYLTKDGKEFKRLCDYVHTFADEIIEKRKIELKNNPDMIKKTHLDFVDILLAARDDNGNGFTKEEMRAEVDTFLFEGHDTTASGAAWAMYALAKYPDMQEKVYQEVQEVLGEKQQLDWNDLQKLTYTSLFIKEVMRMFPPVPGIARQLSKPVVIDGVEVPAGMTVVLSLYLMHRNPFVWENPEEFRPERFSEDKFASRDPYSYVPFSAGPRNCIGQNFAMNEEKVIVSRIVNRFRLVLDTDHPIVPVAEVVLRARHGIKIKFFPR